MPLSSLPDARALSARFVGKRWLAGATVGFLGLSDAVYSADGMDKRLRHDAGEPFVAQATLGGVGMVIFLLGITFTVALVWRKRYPVELTVAGTAAAFFASLGPTFALIGLAHVVVQKSTRTALQVGVPLGVVTAYRTWMDLHSEPHEVSFWATILSLKLPVAAWVPFVVTALLMASFVGLGLWWRTRGQLAVAENVVAVERQQVDSLTDQVSRQTERERLAREIHDGLGHKLSILSAHAGTIQAAGDKAAEDMDPRTRALLKQSADVVQTTAAESVRELQDLLNLLRNPDDPDITAPTKTLRDVRALIDESVAAGMPLIATVYVDDGEACDPHIAQAAYRIVQELLTNARKHAAGIPVRLTVTGGPTDGALILATANQLGPPTGAPIAPGTQRPRAGTGLSGIRERAERWGGDVAAGADRSGVWRVSVRLPWTPAPGGEHV